MSELIIGSPYAYVQRWESVRPRTLEPCTVFQVKRSKDGQTIHSGEDQKQADKFCEQINLAYDDGALTARANITHVYKRKTTAEKLFPTGRRE